MTEKPYIGVKTQSIEESCAFQGALFLQGYKWSGSGKRFTDHTNFYARKHDKTLITCYHDPSIDEESEFLTLDQINGTQPPALEQVLKIHEEMLETNSYCYFELAYTRNTDWMVWICSNAREADPNRKVLLRGQGLTPEEAAQNALINYEGTKNVPTT
ncbi:hypothetical protein [Acinetobacter baumannii]|uniref:hypothetical protein n=1 Tax=Acinetobacter baumannii TaxID=470 RepID=UPI003D2FBDA6